MISKLQYYILIVVLVFSICPVAHAEQDISPTWDITSMALDRVRPLFQQGTASAGINLFPLDTVRQLTAASQKGFTPFSFPDLSKYGFGTVSLGSYQASHVLGIIALIVLFTLLFLLSHTHKKLNQVNEIKTAFKKIPVKK